ncbi:protein of unknown function [Methylorubrum extorquens]|uniref:Uncharacterized protein n=1 Tax=Methylorubrum extorquens TaxID=408 RepID=A0A2N9AMQ9_METEX|nr:protein of unknown function [Methylorubrum extorquens]
MPGDRGSDLHAHRTGPPDLGGQAQEDACDPRLHRHGAQFGHPLDHFAGAVPGGLQGVRRDRRVAADKVEDLRRPPAQDGGRLAGGRRRGEGELLEDGDAADELAGPHEPERRLLAVRVDPRQLHQTGHDLEEAAGRITLVEEGRPLRDLTMRGDFQQGVGSLLVKATQQSSRGRPDPLRCLVHRPLPSPFPELLDTAPVAP